ncbi:MAG TPA: phospholipid carrier-dependent glycosyltransferase, partial [Bryobacteraceae bacterium]|nr:phospholipid carrier-dependent glycosyltransferase [Bryobacteraceae bacterium]
MSSLIPILVGALFTLAVSYALGSLCLRMLPLPRPLVLGVGAAILSVLVFLLLLAGLANPIVFAVVGLLALGVWTRFRAPVLEEPPRKSLDRTSRYLVAILLGSYALIYFVYALAPEIQPDSITYHLGLVAEYLRLGSFPERVGFYEMVPQGMEMLFLFAFAFGRHSAAKLVHFGFLLATLPLIVAIGRRLGLIDLVAWLAAALYFCAPVVATSGTCSYNDAALVFFGLAAFYLLLAWRQTGDGRYLLPAGVTAGFCYAVKFPGIVVLPAVVLAVLAGRPRYRRILPLLAGGLLMFAPWMLRNLLVVGNPLAPLFNGWFPNPYFHAFIDSRLVSKLSSYGGVTLAAAPWQLAAGGKLQGVFGPLFLVLPLGLVALRKPAGRLCWLAAAVLAVPWFVNMGARFLMPAFPFLTLALAMSLGMFLARPLLWACLLLETVVCWPQVVDQYVPQY